MTFLAQQSQQNAFMMQQMMQMTTAVVQALNGLSAGVPPGGATGGPGGPGGGGPPGGGGCGGSVGGVSSSIPHGGGGGSSSGSTSFPAERKMPFNVTLPVCAWREWNTRYKELVGLPKRSRIRKRICSKHSRPAQSLEISMANIRASHKASMHCLKGVSLSLSRERGDTDGGAGNPASEHPGKGALCGSCG